ncbi:hypothetical protein AVEN_56276-1 [Araneus ventricosus]|uniref:Uncharacterized protein n=1 Tax=Araneus ventricosus TaxID=182803 RepID=A0A4Y2G0K3_ARAVE|nr:hypothetical protein AVEN_56276-1 [Araneus ventricosus]
MGITKTGKLEKKYEERNGKYGNGEIGKEVGSTKTGKLQKKYEERSRKYENGEIGKEEGSVTRRHNERECLWSAEGQFDQLFGEYSKKGLLTKNSVTKNLG